MIFEIFVQCIFIFLATIGFSVLFNVKEEELIYCGITGLICFSIYKIFHSYLNIEFYGIILGTFVAVLVARRFAYLRKMPAAVYIIPAIIPLAPGGYIYLTIYNIIFGNYLEVLGHLFTVIKISGGIVIGMSIALSVPNKWFNYNISERRR